MKHYVLFFFSLSILISACSLKTVREESETTPELATHPVSPKSVFSEHQQDRTLAGNLEEKTAMQLRLNTTAVPVKSTDAGTIKTDSSIENKIEQENIKTTQLAPKATSQENTFSTSQTGWPKHEQMNPVDASVALGWLKNGNTRYTKGKLRNDGMWQKDRNRTMAGEKPHTIILSCSDSRVPPEIIFDQKLGEVYTVRTAGQSLDTSSIASIEYGITQLGVKLLVVMGHNSCSSVQAVAQNMQHTPEMGSPAMNQLVSELRPRLQEFSRMPAGAHEHEWANVHGAAKDLIRKSQIVRRAIESGQLKIAPALYDIQSGQVDWK